jgi:putative ATP-dependent endonuclease of OLD family
MQRRRDKGIFENEATGEKVMSLVLGFDEPEIHLHPYIQRSLVKYLAALINNTNNDLKALIRDLFGIDGFIGQIFIVTQSPNIILNDYHQVIRFCDEKGTIKTVSGIELKPDRNIEKHLYLNFPFFKEAFFSRCAIFVEGDSEYSSLPLFARSLSNAVDFDDLGICVIQARGSAISQLLAIGSLYNIPCIGLNDRDVGTTPSTPNHFLTNLRTFEEELVSLLIDGGKEFTLRKILVEYDQKGIDRELQSNVLNKYAFDKYSAVPRPFTANLKLADIQVGNAAILKAYYLTWLSINKSFTLGRLIGQTLSEIEIPIPYITIIKEAVRLAKDV